MADDFAGLFTQAQRNKNAILREISAATGIAFSALADFRAGRTTPNKPDRERIVAFFGTYWPDEAAKRLEFEGQAEAQRQQFEASRSSPLMRFFEDR